MLRSLHSAATGMNAQQEYMDVTANNLANVNTTGFKKSRVNFQDLMYQIDLAPGTMTSQITETPSGRQVGLGVRMASTQKEFSTGTFKATGNPLDVAIEGEGFFQVQLPNGTIGYSRDGAFHRDETGRLVTGAGFPIEPNIVIPPNAVTVNVGQDGMVTALIDQVAQPVQIGQIQIANFINPAGLVAEGGNLFTESGSSGPPVIGVPGQNGIGALRGGFLEGANVRAVEEMINLISAQRAFEFNSKAVQASDQMLREIGQLR